MEFYFIGMTPPYFDPPRYALTDTRIDPEQALVLDALEELPEIPGGASAGAVSSQIRPQDLHHRVAALCVGRGAGLGVRVCGARLLVPAIMKNKILHLNYLRGSNENKNSFCFALNLKSVSQSVCRLLTKFLKIFSARLKVTQEPKMI